jgi:predicted TIM-barrel fold metal-dependent hydrolase
VPVYIHPQIPQRAVRDAYYAGLSEAVGALFAGGGYGWHVETGIQAVRLILSGLFDRLPGLQIILGHWGELALHFTQRLDLITERSPKGRLARSVSDYFRSNVYVTPSGMFHPGSLERTIELIGIDRIMFSVDYPYIPMAPGEARQFFADAALSETDKQKIAHGNWERLTGGP